MNNAIKTLVKSSVVGVYPRKGANQYKTRKGEWHPVASTELVDFKVDFSKFQSAPRGTGDTGWEVLESDDVIISYDSGQTIRTKVPAGALVRRVAWGCPAMAGTMAVILPL